MNGLALRSLKNGRMNTTTIHNPLKKVLSFLTSILIIATSILVPLMAPVPVYANWVTTTIGALIASLTLQSGAANIEPSYYEYLSNPSNTVMQIEIPNDGGITTLPSNLAEQIDQALTDAPVGVQRTIADLNTTQADIVQLNDYLQNNGVSASDVPNISPSTVGENIAASAEQLQKTGKVEPSIGGNPVGGGAFSGMLPVVWNYMSNVRNTNLRKAQALSDYANGKITEEQLNDVLYGKGNILEKKNKTIANGYDINTNDNIFDLLGSYKHNEYSINYYESVNGYSTHYIQYNTGYAFITGKNIYFISKNSNENASGNSNIVTEEYTGTVRNTTFRKDTIGGGDGYYTYYISVGSPYVLYNTSMSTYENRIDGYNAYRNNNDINIDDNNKSPSLIGADGQLTAEQNTDLETGKTYYITSQKPTYNYNNYTMEPIPLNEYNQFIQSIQNQIVNNVPQQNIQNTLNEFLNQYLKEKGSEPLPTQVPIIPDQPVPSVKPTITPEQTNENIEIMATEDLKDKFPFCIPWDVYYVFALLEDEREAPQVNFNIDLGVPGTHTINIDFEEWDDVASILRTLELILFILGLALGTKKIMGGTGA